MIATVQLQQCTQTYAVYLCVCEWEWVAYPILVYQMWKHYGDERVMRDHYPNLLLYVQSLMKAVAQTGLHKMFACTCRAVCRRAPCGYRVEGVH